MARGEVYADDYIGPHVPGYVHWEIVAHTAVRKHHALGADRREQPGDGHGGTHGQVDGAIVPDLGLAGGHIRCHAGEGDGEFEEVRGIRIPHRAGSDDLEDVLPVHEARRKASHVVVDHYAVYGSPLFVRAQVEHALLSGSEGHISCDKVLIVVRPVKERDGYQEFLLIASMGIGDVFAVHLVAEGHFPVDVVDEAVQIVRIIAQGVQGAQQAADAGAHHHVHGQIVLFYEFEGSHGSRSLGAAAGKDQGHGGPVSADLAHPGLDAPYRLGILGIQAESGGGTVLRQGAHAQEETGRYKG